MCEVSATAVWKWLNSSKRLPAEHVLAVEAATGISRHLLRPDIYPADLGPSPAWRGVDNGAQRVAFNQSNGLQRGHAA
jgi:DNA-binding transcriptional regulator YdaS (Cro superfamily)